MNVVAPFRASCLVVALAGLACGGSTPPPPDTSGPRTEPAPARRTAHEDVSRAPLGGGSSDGTTCEQAREMHPDEVGIGAARGDGAEPSDGEFSGPLARGTYLDECEVTAETKVDVCAAITGGKAVGVTVATNPSDPEKERCVAGRIREIPFPSHPRLRVVRTTF